MVEVRRRTGRRRTASGLAGEILERDFPGLELVLGEDPGELRSRAVRAVALPEREVPEEPADGIDYFLIPVEGADSEVGLLFREGDGLLQRLRRFYLPPLIFAGAGPGGVDGMTVAVIRALERADLILADRLCGEGVLSFANPGAEIVPVGKRRGDPGTKQDQIQRRLLVEARRGRRIVRLKGGDPAVFGRLAEETNVFRERGMAYRVLPGVSAALAAAAFVGQPLTMRETTSEVVLSTGILSGGRHNPFPLEGDQTPAIALYMSRTVLAERMANLRAAGHAPGTPVVIVEKVGHPEARAVTGTVETIAGLADREGVGTPAVVLVGSQYHAPDHLPLAGVRIWLPAERETAESHREHLEELGATCVLSPLIEPVALPVDKEALFETPYDWVVFTSRKSPDFFFDLLARAGLDARAVPRVAALGQPAIRKLRARGIEPDLVPPESTRDSLGRALIDTGLDRMRILIPGSAVAPDHVREMLLPHAAEVVRADTYTLRFPRVESPPEADVVLFSSESTVRAARDGGLLEEIRRRSMVVGGIGTATRSRIEKEGLVLAVAPDGCRPEDLAHATHRHFARRDVALLGDQSP